MSITKQHSDESAFVASGVPNSASSFLATEIFQSKYAATQLTLGSITKKYAVAHVALANAQAENETNRLALEEATQRIKTLRRDLLAKETMLASAQSALVGIQYLINIKDQDIRLTHQQLYEAHKLLREKDSLLLSVHNSPVMRLIRWIKTFAKNVLLIRTNKP